MYARKYPERTEGEYTGQGAGEVREAKAKRYTSEEIQAAIDIFLANDGIIRRYGNVYPVQEIIK
jgi:hypothetical protein